MKRSVVGIVLFLLVLGAGAGAGFADTIYTDNFDGTVPNLPWVSVRGDWSTSGGTFGVTPPTNNPPTAGLLPFVVTNFAAEYEIGTVNDGGFYVWSDDTANVAVMLIVRSGDIYWHEIASAAGGPWTIHNLATHSLSSASPLRVRVVGQDGTLSAYLNGSSTAITTYTPTMVSSGRIGLYDMTGQRFDNFSLTVPDNAVPEPTTLSLLALAFVSLFVGTRLRRAH